MYDFDPNLPAFPPTGAISILLYELHAHVPLIKKVGPVQRISNSLLELLGTINPIYRSLTPNEFTHEVCTRIANDLIDEEEKKDGRFQKIRKMGPLEKAPFFIVHVPRLTSQYPLFRNARSNPVDTKSLVLSILCLAKVLVHVQAQRRESPKEPNLMDQLCDIITRTLDFIEEKKLMEETRSLSLGDLLEPLLKHLS